MVLLFSPPGKEAENALPSLRGGGYNKEEYPHPGGMVKQLSLRREKEKKITLALSEISLLDFQQVCSLLQSFTAKFGMDWRGSTEA